MRYGFGDCVLALASRELTRGSSTVPLAPQVFDLLAYLIAHRDRVVSKDELIATIWEGRIVSDAALTTRLYAVRCAIGDSGDAQRFIKTFSRRGVRFVGTVVELGEPQRDRVMVPVSVGPSIAVLAFKDMDGECAAKAIGLLMSEEVRIELTRLPWLKVAGEMAESRMNDARYLLHGRVKRVGGRCRVTAEIVDLASGANIWAERFDTDHPQSLSGQRSIAEAVARAAAVAILACERSRAIATKPNDLGAWEAYQLGMWHMSNCASDTIGTARGYFQQAIDIDPGFASGYSALAWAEMMAASIYSRMAVAEGCELGRPLVLKAIALDPDDAESRARLALVEFLKGDLGGAFEEAKAVLTANPDCASALGIKGAALIFNGRRREGRAAIGKFLRLSPHDPARPVRLTQVATSYYLDGNFAEAARTAGQVARRFPQHPFAHRWLAAALGQLGRVEEAAAALQTLREKWPTSFEMYVASRPPSYCSAEYKPLLAGLKKAGLGI